MDCTVQSSDHTLHCRPIKRLVTANLKQLPALNIFHPICPKKPTNQGEGWPPVTKFGHLSFKRVNCGHLFGFCRVDILPIRRNSNVMMISPS